MGGVIIEPGNQSTVLSKSVVNSAAGGSLPAPAGTAGQIIRVYKLFLVISGTTNITFQDGSTALSGPMAFIANGAIALGMDGQPWFTTSSGNAFNVNSSGAVQVSGTVYYTSTPFGG